VKIALLVVAVVCAVVGCVTITITAEPGSDAEIVINTDNNATVKKGSTRAPTGLSGVAGKGPDLSVGPHDMAQPGKLRADMTHLIQPVADMSLPSKKPADMAVSPMPGGEGKKGKNNPNSLERKAQ
jgi:hypothetical protein